MKKISIFFIFSTFFLVGIFILFDDKPDIISDRIALYKKETGPAIDYFKTKPGFISIKAQGKEPGDIAKDIIKEIQNEI